MASNWSNGEHALEVKRRLKPVEDERDRLRDALQQMVDWVKDGCPDDGRNFVMTEAQASLKNIVLLPLGDRQP
jgi:hypothetical protein